LNEFHLTYSSYFPYNHTLRTVFPALFLRKRYFPPSPAVHVLLQMSALFLIQNLRDCLCEMGSAVINIDILEAVLAFLALRFANQMHTCFAFGAVGFRSSSAWKRIQFVDGLAKELIFSEFFLVDLHQLHKLDCVLLFDLLNELGWFFELSVLLHVAALSFHTFTQVASLFAPEFHWVGKVFGHN